MSEKFFVGCNSYGEADRIFFNALDAMKSKYRYIDSFNEEGIKQNTYKLVGSVYRPIQGTTNFYGEN